MSRSNLAKPIFPAFVAIFSAVALMSACGPSSPDVSAASTDQNAEITANGGCPARFWSIPLLSNVYADEDYFRRCVKPEQERVRSFLVSQETNGFSGFPTPKPNDLNRLGSPWSEDDAPASSQRVVVARIFPTALSVKDPLGGWASTSVFAIDGAFPYTTIAPRSPRAELLRKALPAAALSTFLPSLSLAETITALQAIEKIVFLKAAALRRSRHTREAQDALLRTCAFYTYTKEFVEKEGMTFSILLTDPMASGRSITSFGVFADHTDTNIFDYSTDVQDKHCAATHIYPTVAALFIDHQDLFRTQYQNLEKINDEVYQKDLALLSHPDSDLADEPESVRQQAARSYASYWNLLMEEAPLFHANANCLLANTFVPVLGVATMTKIMSEKVYRTKSVDELCQLLDEPKTAACEN